MRPKKLMDTPEPLILEYKLDRWMPTIEALGRIPDSGILVQTLDHESEELIGHRRLELPVNQNHVIRDNGL